MNTAEKTEQKKTLQEIVNNYRMLLHNIDDLDGEVLPELEQELSQVEEAFDQKVDRCLWVAKEAAAQAEVYKERAKMLEDRVRVLGAQEQRLKDYVLANMLALGIDKVDTAHFVARVAETPFSVEVEDPGSFINKYMETRCVRTKYELDKVVIKEVILGGRHLEGAILQKRYTLRVK